MKNTLLATLAIIALSSSTTYARDTISVVGSSTVYPFVTSAAENFSKKGFSSPIVESTGTGGGIKLFCAGVGDDTPDAVNASRAIKDSEVESCAKNGVVNPIELKIGKDVLSIASSKETADMDLTIEQIFLALAKEIPVDGKLVANPNKLWSDIDSGLPSKKIEVLGPPPTSGTRDSFVELAMIPACKALLKKNEIKLDEKAEKSVCGSMREDGAYIDAGENDNLIVQKLASNPDILGIFGFSFLENSRDVLKDVKINGVEATFESAADGSYPLSRDLFVYIKSEHLDLIEGLKEFAGELVSDAAIGEDGYLVDKGLIVLPEADREAQRAKLN
jgi:phosphate transport system substrate-binding protein